MENHPTCPLLNHIGPNYRPTAVQAKRQYLLTLQVSRYCNFTFEEQHSAVSAHFTSKQTLPFAIQEYIDPENPGLIRQNTMLLSSISVQTILVGH